MSGLLPKPWLNLTPTSLSVAIFMICVPLLLAKKYAEDQPTNNYQAIGKGLIFGFTLGTFFNLFDLFIIADNVIGHGSMDGLYNFFLEVIAIVFFIASVFYFIKAKFVKESSPHKLKDPINLNSTILIMVFASVILSFVSAAENISDLGASFYFFLIMMASYIYVWWYFEKKPISSLISASMGLIISIGLIIAQKNSISFYPYILYVPALIINILFCATLTNLFIKSKNEQL